jgi:hypothetical protein
MTEETIDPVEAEKAAIIGTLVIMRDGLDVAARTAGPADTGALRFASGFLEGVIESIEDNLHRGEAPQPKSSIILP